MPVRLTIKDNIRESRLFNERAAFALFITVMLLLVVGARLVYLQVISHAHFSTLSDGNRINIVATPPMRGFIFDRNGVMLAQNIPSFSLEIIPEQVDDLEGTIEELRRLIAISDEDIRRFNRQLRQRRPYSSISLRFHLNDSEIARFAINRHRFPGVETEPRVIRHYPHGKLAAHAVGYVGRISEEELQQLDASIYSATRFIGKVGVERYYEDVLHGQVGFRQVEVNALGRRLRETDHTAPIPGRNLHLALDAGLQQVAEQALNRRRGAVVAIDPRNGDVLAFVSTPAYDPNLFVTGIDVPTYNQLQNSPDKPLFNRALNGQYPPGSTVKPLIGLAGLEDRRIRINTTTFCPGWFSLEGDSHRYRDWREHGHGTTDLEKAIVESCDVYFYDLARALGIDRIHDYLSLFNLGRATGIDLRNESAGLLPSRDWKRAQRGQPWYPGETLITGIGQGYMLTTPLQLAQATAVLAMQGRAHVPRLVHSIEAPENGVHQALAPMPQTPLEIVDPHNWRDIVESMRKTVHTVRGTAFGISRGADYAIAGKTGTAQVFSIGQDERYIKEEVAERLRDHALFVSFAPADNPRIAVAVIIENAGSGSTEAAPVARVVMDHYLGGGGS
jgi:penicillin-binding protein 2